MIENYDPEDLEGGLFDPAFMLTYALYHVTTANPNNAWMGMKRMIEYLTDAEEPDSAVALDILARYALVGWHPLDPANNDEDERVLTEEEQEEIIRDFRRDLGMEDDE